MENTFSCFSFYLMSNDIRIYVCYWKNLVGIFNSKISISFNRRMNKLIVLK